MELKKFRFSEQKCISRKWRTSNSLLLNNFIIIIIIVLILILLLE